MQLSEYAAALFREHGADVTRELGSLETWFELGALAFLGEIERISERLVSVLDGARRRGDRYTESIAATFNGPYVALAKDRPEEAFTMTRAALEPWGELWRVPHWTAFAADLQTDLYLGRGGSARDRVNAAWERTLSAPDAPSA